MLGPWWRSAVLVEAVQYTHGLGPAGSDLGHRPVRGTRRRGRAGIAVLSCAGLLAACGAGGPATTVPSTSLSAAERRVFDQATEAVAAYRQTVADLYTGTRKSLDDLGAVAVAPELGIAARSISQARTLGYRSEPAGAEVVLVAAEPTEIELDASPQTVVLRACVDATAMTAVAPSGLRQSGVRERLEYRVVRAGSAASARWVVSEVDHSARPSDRQC